MATQARSPAESDGDAGAEELDEPPGKLHLTQPLGDRQSQIGRQRPLAQGAGQADADDVGHPQHDRHPEHHAFGLESADSPGQHADAVDHRRVTVGADQGVGKRPCHAVAVVRRDDLGEPLEVDRVHDAGARRMHADIPLRDAVAHFMKR